MFFWNSLAFSVIQQMLAIWSLVPLPFLIPAWTSGGSRFMNCWSLAWRILSITLLSCEMSAVVWCWNENWPFPVLWPLLSFPNLRAHWVQHFYSIIFRIWNTSPVAITALKLSFGKPWGTGIQKLLRFPPQLLSGWMATQVLIYFSLKDNCFTVFCWFLPNININQP